MIHSGPWPLLPFFPPWKEDWAQLPSDELCSDTAIGQAVPFVQPPTPKGVPGPLRCHPPYSILGHRIKERCLKATASPGLHPGPAQPTCPWSLRPGTLTPALGLSSLSCLFSSVPCTHARSTLPRLWMQGLFITSCPTRSYARIACWARPGSAARDILRCSEVDSYPGEGEAGGAGSRCPQTGHTSGEDFPERPPSAHPTLGLPDGGSHRPSSGPELDWKD